MKKARKLPPPAAGASANIQPVFPPPSVELAPAYQVLEGDAVLLLMDKKLEPTTPPPDLANVKVPDAPVRDNVTTLPAEPCTLNAPTVIVVFGKTMVCATVLVLAISENVIPDPVMVVVDVDVFPPIVNFP